MLVVFAGTDRFGAAEQYSAAATLRLPVPSDITPELVAHARRGVEQIYRGGFLYKKAGVTLLELVPAAPAQGGLFDGLDRPRARRVSEAVDRINKRWGEGTVRYGAEPARRWRGNSEKRSPRYTTKWEELLKIEA